MSQEKQKNTVSIKDLVESDREFQQHWNGYMRWLSQQEEAKEEQRREEERQRARLYFVPFIQALKELYPTLEDNGAVHTGLYDEHEFSSEVKIVFEKERHVTVSFDLKRDKLMASLFFYPSKNIGYNIRKSASIDKRGYQNELKIFIAQYLARFEKIESIQNHVES